MAMLRAAVDGYDRIVEHTHRIKVDVDSWLADSLLAESIPLAGGTLSEAGDQAIPEVLTIRVPAVDSRGQSWRPDSSSSPLAQYGQRLYVRHNVIRGDQSRATIGLGWYAVQDWELNDGEVEVTATGLAQIVADYGLLTSTSPPAGSTFASEVIRLVDGQLPVDIDAALVDRAVPANMAWQDDRLDALTTLLKAWPARQYVDEQGVLNVTTPYVDQLDAAEVTLYELGGTVVENTDSGTRQGLPSLIIAKGEDATTDDRSPVVGYAIDTAPASPTYVGTYGYKTETFSSPLLTTAAAALKAAQTRLETTRRQARTIPVTTYPDARLRPGVRVDFQRRSKVGRVVVDGPLLRCRVQSSRLALTADGGAQALELGVIP